VESGGLACCGSPNLRCCSHDEKPRRNALEFEEKLVGDTSQQRNGGLSYYMCTR
jgi:hypothetical protein